MKPIMHTPNAVLSTPAKEIKIFDKKLNKIIADMKKALIATKNPKGVGLAAPQIGLPLRIFITRPNEKTEIRVFINPMILKKSNGLTDGVPDRENPPSRSASEGHGKMEGCLSVPNLWGKVHRASSLTLAYLDEKGTAHEDVFTGFLSTIIQHETDHVNGILFVQRVLEQKGKLFEIVTDENGKEEFEEVKLK